MSWTTENSARCESVTLSTTTSTVSTTTATVPTAGTVSATSPTISAASAVSGVIFNSYVSLKFIYVDQTAQTLSWGHAKREQSGRTVSAAKFDLTTFESRMMGNYSPARDPVFNSCFV
jgi:hypothetical protein